MADVFISYRNTPERRQIVRRLALFFQVHGISSWWDYGLEAGSQFEDRIKDEIDTAKIVIPLWCFESVFRSKWVIKEATWGANKLFPMRLQDVTPPPAFSHLHSANLIAWDGDLQLGLMDQILVSLFRAMQRPLSVPHDLRQELALLPPFEPLPSHSQDYEALLNELRDSYVQVADMPSIQTVQGIGFNTPIGELCLPESDLYGSIYDILDVRYMGYDLREGAMDELDTDELATVGDLIEFLLRWRRDTAVRLVP